MYVLKETVIVKIRGHTAWPASIEKIENLKTRMRFHVIFYGTHQTATCSDKEIFPFKDYLKNEITKIKIPNPDLQKALDEANKSLIDQKSNPTSQLLKAKHEINERILQEKILNRTTNEEQDLETSLSLAAEAGNLLLSENNILKQEIFELKQKHLTLQSELEDKMKAAEEEKENLTQLINNLKNDHDKEKTHLIKTLEEKEHLMEIFETQTDNDQKMYESKIKCLANAASKKSLNYEQKLNTAHSSLEKTQEEHKRAAETNEKMLKSQKTLIENLSEETKSLREELNYCKNKEEIKTKTFQTEKETLKRRINNLLEKIEHLEAILAHNTKQNTRTPNNTEENQRNEIITEHSHGPTDEENPYRIEQIKTLSTANQQQINTITVKPIIHQYSDGSYPTPEKQNPSKILKSKTTNTPNEQPKIYGDCDMLRPSLRITSTQAITEEKLMTKNNQLKNRKTYETRIFFNSTYKTLKEKMPQTYGTNHHDTIGVNELTNITNTSIPAQVSKPRNHDKRGAKQTSLNKKANQPDTSPQSLQNEMTQTEDHRGDNQTPIHKKRTEVNKNISPTKNETRRPRQITVTKKLTQRDQEILAHRNQTMTKNDLKENEQTPLDKLYPASFLDMVQTKRTRKELVHKTKLYLNSSLKARKSTPRH